MIAFSIKKDSKVPFISKDIKKGFLYDKNDNVIIHNDESLRMFQE